MDELNIRLSLDLDSSLDRLAMDSDGIHRVLLNILSNAIDAVDEVDGSRSIDIKTELSGNGRYLHISIHDSGRAFPSQSKSGSSKSSIRRRVQRGRGLAWR